MTKFKGTKRALLMSALALLLCVSMLVGSTFAWFTDSVTSGSNVIQAGTLDIVMEYWDGDSWEDAEGQVLEFVKGGNYHGYVGEVLWEPGCTYELPKIRVRNEGNLAAKVLLKVNGITGDEKLLEAIEFETKVANIPDSLKTGSAGAVYSAMEGNSYGLMYGTADGTVMMDWSLMGKGHTSLNTGHTDTSAEFTISGHMKEEAGNEYQGLKIEGVSITALATQEVYEYDSFTREYDKQAQFPEVTVVSSAADLKEALAAGGNIVLDTDITVAETIVVPKTAQATLDLNGNDLSYAVSNSGASAIITNNGNLTIIGEGKISFVAENPDLQAIPAYATNTITNEGTLTIGEGVVVENGSDGGASYAVDNKGVFTLDGGTLIGKRCALRIAKYNQDNVKFTMNSGLVKGATPAWIQLPGSDSTAAPSISVVINGGTFESTKATSADNNVLYTYSYGNSHANTSIVINGGDFIGGTVSIGSGYKGDAPSLTINGGNFDYDVLQWLDGDASTVVYAAN